MARNKSMNVILSNGKTVRFVRPTDAYIVASTILDGYALEWLLWMDAGRFELYRKHNKKGWLCRLMFGDTLKGQWSHSHLLDALEAGLGHYSIYRANSDPREY